MLNWPTHRYLFAINVSRILACVGQFSAVVVADSVLLLELPFTPLYGFIAAGLVMAALTHWRLRFRQRFAVHDAEIGVHLMVDAVLLSILLYLSGGATNPFVSFLLVPIAIGASVLSPRWIVAITAFAIACYSALMKWYEPLPGGAHVHGDGFQWHIWGMWITFVVSALLLAGFIGRAALWARTHQQLLAQIREQKLRDEQLLSMATLAAGTAHELGTPLTTIAVLTDDLAADERDPQRQQDWHMIKQQLQRCREILQRIRGAAEPVVAKPMHEIVAAMLEQFALLKPQTSYAIALSDNIRDRIWHGERTLQQAIINVLNNAAEVSDHIDISVSGNDLEWVWQISDRGHGWHDDARAQWGLPLRSRKPFGVGIGLFLTNASIERAGGHVEMHEREGGGTCVTIVLPYQASATQ